MAERDGWQVHPDRLAEAVDERTRAIVLSNPTNPSGHVPSPATLSALVALAEERGILLISDESYDRLVYEGSEFTTAASVGSVGGHLAVIRSLSKSYALAPWRVGYLIAAEKVIDACMKVLEWESLYVSDVAQAAAHAAIVGPQAWLTDAIDRYSVSRGMVGTAIRENEVLSSVSPAGTPFYFVNISAPLAPTAEVFLEHGIPVVDGRYFSMPGYVRLPFGGSHETIAELSRRLSSIRPAGTD
jgi:aspartate/methionine/tyrosine aminotransferase